MRGLAHPRPVGLLLIPALLLAALAAGLMQPLPAEPRDPALVAYLRMGGDLADICGQRGRSHGSLPCDGCCLIGPALLPPPPGDWQRLLPGPAFAAAEAPQTAGRRVGRYRTSPPRAPPIGQA